MRNQIASHGAPPVLEQLEPLLLRKASMRDIHGLLELINGYAADGVMLPRTEFEMSANIRDFTLAFSDGRLVGCGALHFYSPVAGEVRSLAVAKDAKNRGAGRALVDALEQEAREFGLHSIFAFTYATGFFEKAGFKEVERGELPLKVWKDCLRCPKFQCCDEIAVVKHLVSERTYFRETADPLVRLPIVKRPS
ncbi:MAG: N-acetyltransferase [Bryobacteraceae bacterium]